MPFNAKFALSRRAFATGIGGALAAMGTGDAADASVRPEAAASADLRDAALRGLAGAVERGDPVLTAKAQAVLVKLESEDPEGAALVRLYRRFDRASAFEAYHDDDDDGVSIVSLAPLHGAVHEARAISFRYADLTGATTKRTVLPLALVHPPQGIKLLAWCALRQDCRQFFIRSLWDLTVHDRHFGDRRLALLRMFAEQADARA